MASEPNRTGWLLISVSTAGAAGTLRVQVWRKLRALGALYLQHSVCLLPDQEPIAREIRRLLDRVRHHGGTGRMLRIQVTSAAEQAGLIAELNAARDDEYDELLERLPELRGEMAKELSGGRVSYAEVEECEADLERFRSWLRKIAARDYFDAPRGAAARASVDAAAAELASFEQAALSAESPAPPTRRLRVAGEP